MSHGVAKKTAAKFLLLQEGVEKVGVTDQNTSIASTNGDSTSFSPSTKGKAATDAMRLIRERNDSLSCVACMECINERQQKVQMIRSAKGNRLFCPECGGVIE